MRFAAIVGGVALGLAGLLVALLYGLFIGFGCEGSDAGEPPVPGTFAHSVCEGPGLSVAFVAFGLTACLAPVIGGVVAAGRRAPHLLLASAALSAGAVCALGVVLVVVHSGGANSVLFVGAPAVACVCLAVIAVRLGRKLRGDGHPRRTD